mmetsp:Transcript_39707/g.97599  ORF Transcript_39707/g.97599 Transcript_39707/m.97599 type:complete len:292 (+) Transcript_39707:437-1312(+)
MPQEKGKLGVVDNDEAVLGGIGRRSTPLSPRGRTHALVPHLVLGPLRQCGGAHARDQVPLERLLEVLHRTREPEPVLDLACVQVGDERLRGEGDDPLDRLPQLLHNLLRVRVQLRLHPRVDGVLPLCVAGKLCLYVCLGHALCDPPPQAQPVDTHLHQDVVIRVPIVVPLDVVLGHVPSDLVHKLALVRLHLNPKLKLHRVHAHLLKHVAMDLVANDSVSVLRESHLMKHICYLLRTPLGHLKHRHLERAPLHVLVVEKHAKCVHARHLGHVFAHIHPVPLVVDPHFDLRR